MGGRTVLLREQISFVKGPNLAFRLVQPSDASYIYGLRSDPAYNAHLSEVRGGVADQREWIEQYKEREARLAELYYVIERIRDSVPCGLVRLYDIGNESFTWGSWILDEQKPPKAALECAVIIYTIGFEKLEIPKAVFDVRLDNLHTIAFHKRFGARFSRETELDAHFILRREEFLVGKANHMSVLEGAKHP